MAALTATIGASYWMIGRNPGVDGLTDACTVVFLTYSVMLVLYGFALWRGSPEEKPK